MPLPKPPQPEPTRHKSLTELAPQFSSKVFELVTAIPNAVVFEALRTDERQRWLYGFGRDYDDGRGIVTKALSAFTSWHAFGMAVDIIHDKLEWSAPKEWWQRLGDKAVKLGLHWGGNWHSRDLPHVQWYIAGEPETPTAHDAVVAQEQGIEAVQLYYKART